MPSRDLIADESPSARRYLIPFGVAALSSFPPLFSLVSGWFCVVDEWWFETVGWTYLYLVQAGSLGICYILTTAALLLIEERLIGFVLAILLSVLYVFSGVVGWYVVSMSFLDF